MIVKVLFFHVQCQLSVDCCLVYLVCCFYSCFLFLVPVCLTFTSARDLVRALVDGPGSQPTDIWNHTQCAARALTPRPPHVCHRQKDWAVSVGSHMQQDMDFSWAPPHLGAPIPLFEYRHVRKPRPKKLAIVHPETQLSSARVPTRLFRPAERHMYRIIAGIVVDIPQIEDLPGSGFAGQASRNKQSESLAEKQGWPT